MDLLNIGEGGSTEISGPWSGLLGYGDAFYGQNFHRDGDFSGLTGFYRSIS